MRKLRVATDRVVDAMELLGLSPTERGRDPAISTINDYAAFLVDLAGQMDRTMMA